VWVPLFIGRTIGEAGGLGEELTTGELRLQFNGFGRGEEPRRERRGGGEALIRRRRRGVDLA
jgi:hypothetical protein